MRLSYWLIIVLTSVALRTAAQPSLDYYFPDHVSINPSIPIPKSIIGHEIGEWHLTHDKLISYLYALDQASDRITLEISGYTHEHRPLLLLTITSPENQKNIESIRQQHVNLTDPSQSSALDTKKMPIVIYMGFSVHGNEASGVNASVLTAYYLAAAQGTEIEEYLQHVVILMDPCFNPDGMQRFSSWVNAQKSSVVSADPNDMEHNEPWPGGRYNHYWFDLNRDWLVTQHPESAARVKNFHRWKPTMLTDHHEMSTNSTFFFQPGVPSRNHPLTPAKNYELTKRIGEFHAKALDEIGSLYYTQEDFDDFYYGKGSSFPDVQGAIGILFEQGSARGHAQESVNGVLRFEFAIRNHFTTSLSSLKAAFALREELLNYQRQFFIDARNEAASDPVKAIVFAAEKDPARTFMFADMLSRQQINVYPLSGTQSFNGKNFQAGSSFVVPLQQAQYKLIKSMFEKRTSFRDSIFYDISAWTLPLAFGLEYEELKTTPSIKQPASDFHIPAGKRIDGQSDYAYAFESNGYFSPRALYRLLKNNVRVKVASEPFHDANGKIFNQGTLVVPLSAQERIVDEIEYTLQEITDRDGIDVYALHTGLDYNGASLGSSSFMTLRKPEIAMIVGDGVSASDAGELWHLLDVRYQVPVTRIPVDVFNRTNINRYNTIILPPTQSGFSLSENAKEKLKAWVQQGGVLIGFESALSWMTNAGLGRFDTKKDEGSIPEGKTKKEMTSRPYKNIEAYAGAQATSGAIFEAIADITHPLLYGYDKNTIAIFKQNNLFMEKAKNFYGNPLVFTSTPLLSGYMSKNNYQKVKDSSVAGVTSMGQGRIIGFTDNLCFRAFWLGTNKIFTNAIFFGPLISNQSSR